MAIMLVVALVTLLQWFSPFLLFSPQLSTANAHVSEYVNQIAKFRVHSDWQKLVHVNNTVDKFLCFRSYLCCLGLASGGQFSAVIYWILLNENEFNSFCRFSQICLLLYIKQQHLVDAVMEDFGFKPLEKGLPLTMSHKYRLLDAFSRQAVSSFGAIWPTIQFEDNSPLIIDALSQSSVVWRDIRVFFFPSRDYYLCLYSSQNECFSRV